MAQSPATKVINRAARTSLRPLGLIQQGRSRSWMDDHGWWIVGVWFKSSSFSQGSGLVLYSDFMWNGGLRDHLAMSMGGVDIRERGRLREQTGRVLWMDYSDLGEEAFAQGAEQLAMRAAAEVTEWRAQWPTLDSWRDHLLEVNEGLFWRCYDTGFACGITGRIEEAQRSFATMLEGDDDDRDWVVAAKRDAEQLHELVTDTEAFTQEATTRAQELRARLHLQPL